MIKADLHLHTCYSFDCLTGLEQIVKRCLELDIKCIAVADHGTIAGALELKRMAPFTVIVAEEVMTPAGEIMGMFLKERVPSPSPTQEAISNIRAQGGLICIPHPYDITRRSALKKASLENLAKQVDIIEAFNARDLLQSSSTQAWQLIRKYNLSASAGSDAHTIGEIGRTYVEIPEFVGSNDFLDCLKQGKMFGRKSNPLVHFASNWAKIRKHL